MRDPLTFEPSFLESVWESLKMLIFIDQHLKVLVENYGVYTYWILAGVIFAETGICLFAFLPGDVFLFLIGVLCAGGSLNIVYVILLLTAAGFFGNLLNYFTGKLLGKHIIKNYPLIVKKEHFDRSQAFYNRYGAAVVMLSRFIPILRTFVPFFAGVVFIPIVHYTLYSLLGALIWVGGMSLLGYFFGQLQIVQDNLTLLIILAALLPLIAIAVPIGRYLWLHLKKITQKDKE